MKPSFSRTGVICATTALTALNLIGITPALAIAVQNEPAITQETATSSFGSGNDPVNTTGAYHSVAAMTSLSAATKLALMQQNIKYVFVIFQENRSFDHYFGTFPGVNGLFQTYPGASPSDQYAQPGNTFSSFKSTIVNVDGTTSTVSPFLVPRTIVNNAGASVSIYPESILSVDHAHTGYINDYHADRATRSIPQNDGYPLDQEGYYWATDSSVAPATISTPGSTIFTKSTTAPPTANPNLQTKQKGEIVMGHLDCDGIPFLWQYADRFTVFDNMHQTATGPSTPNAIAMIGAQTGDTQWVKHPNNYDSYSSTSGAVHIQYSLPNLTDAPPYPGSASDTAAIKPPYGPDESTNGSSTTGPYTPDPGQATLTFASLPLSFMGSQINAIRTADQHAAQDLVDVVHDIPVIAAQNPSIAWGWYQQGAGSESFDNTAFGDDNAVYTAAPAHASYVVHHNGPLYFGYVGDNTTEQGNLHGLTQFYTDVSSSNLNPNGGVYYIRGGYYNNLKQVAADPNPTVQQFFAGNDDHGSYSDSQISESMVAATVNAIASSPYWSQSAIIITYDESDGFYDHQPEQFRTYGPDGQPETGGPRIPLIVISPYGVTHGVSHVYSEHSSVIRFIEELKGLVPLANLPDEASAAQKGATLCATPPTYSGSTVAPTLITSGGINTGKAINPFCTPSGQPQPNLGPADQLTGMGDLMEAFDNDRLLGNVATIPASYVMIPQSVVQTLPHYSTVGACANPALNIVPTDYTGGYSSAAFDPTGAQTKVPVIDPPPADFNPRPTVSLGSPYYNTSGNTTAGSTTGTGGPWNN